MIKKLLSLLLVVGAGVGAYFAVVMVLWQHEAVTRFVPVEARVVSAEVKRHSGKRTTYSPEITYTYSYEGRAYRSSQVFPVSESSSYGWASGIVAQYGGERPEISLEAGRPRVTAYANPRKPEEAVLVRKYSFVPYFFAMAAGIGALIGVGLLTGVLGGGRDMMAAVPLDEYGTQLLMPTKSLGEGSRHAWMWLAGSAAVVAPAWGHWVVVAGQNAVLISLALLGVCGTLGVVAFRRWTLTRHVSDARVKVKPAPLVRGQPFVVEVEADVLVPLQITAGRARVRCVEHYKEKRGNKTSYGTRTRGEKVVVLSGVREFAQPGVYSGGGAVMVEQGELPPTTDLVVKTYPHYTWEVRVEIEIVKHADFCGVYPLKAE